MVRISCCMRRQLVQCQLTTARVSGRMRWQHWHLRPTLSVRFILLPAPASPQNAEAAVRLLDKSQVAQNRTRGSKCPLSRARAVPLDAEPLEADCDVCAGSARVSLVKLCGISFRSRQPRDLSSTSLNLLAIPLRPWRWGWRFGGKLANLSTFRLTCPRTAFPISLVYLSRDS